MDCYEPEVQALEASSRGLQALPDGQQPDRPARPIAFYGSSSIRMWTSLADDFPGLRVVNLGFGGSTLAACVYFFERIVVPVQPKSLVFYAGDNDLGDGKSPEQVRAAFQALRQKILRDLGLIRFAFVSIKPSPARQGIRDRIVLANRLIQSELTGWPGASYIDVHREMLGPDGLPRPELYAPDGLHLSPEGYRLWARVLNAERDKYA